MGLVRIRDILYIFIRKDIMGQIYRFDGGGWVEYLSGCYHLINKIWSEGMGVGRSEVREIVK